MEEKHSVEISMRMDELLARLKFDIEKQPPAHLPAISVAVANLYGMKQGLNNGDEKQMAEINLLKQVTNQIRNHDKGGGNDVPPGFDRTVNLG